MAGSRLSPPSAAKLPGCTNGRPLRKEATARQSWRRVHGTPQVVVAGAETITAYQPESGAIAWTYQGIPSCCVSTVVVADDLCVAAGGWPDRKLICIRVSKSPDSDKWVPEMLWESDKSSEAPYIPTPLYHAGKLYVVHDQGVVMCRDATSGKIDLETASPRKLQCLAGPDRRPFAGVQR